MRERDSGEVTRLLATRSFLVTGAGELFLAMVLEQMELITEESRFKSTTGGGSIDVV